MHSSSEPDNNWFEILGLSQGKFTTPFDRNILNQEFERRLRSASTQDEEKHPLRETDFFGKFPHV
jgi:hypothetical protein